VKDYKAVNGVKMAFTRVNRVAGQEIQVHLDTIEVNADMPKDRFDLPEEIKALLRKNGAIPDAK
jgi:lactam utilization protein B